MTISFKTCRNCKTDKLIEDFPYFSTNNAGRKNTCKTCTKHLSILRKQLKSQNPPPVSGNCPICGTYTTDWILDHCHFSDEFRGYICNSCNLGLGRFNDDEKLLYKAIEYLSQKHKIIDYSI